MATANGFKKTAILVVALLGLAMASTQAGEVESGRRAAEAWEKYKHEQEEHGVVFDFKHYIPAPVPEAQNFALTPIVASSYEWMLDGHGDRSEASHQDKLSMSCWCSDPHPSADGWMDGKGVSLRAWQAYYRRAALQTNLFPIPLRAGQPAADVFYALSIYTNHLEQLRTASQLPDSRFPLKYDAKYPGGILLPHLEPLKKCVWMLELRACAELEAGKSDQTLADVELMLKLTDSIQTESCTTSQSARIVMMSATLQPVWEGLSRHQWSNTQLVKLAAALGKFNFLRDYKNAMAGDQASFLTTLERLSPSSDFDTCSNVMELVCQIKLDTNTYSLFVSLGSEQWCCRNELFLATIYAEDCQPALDAVEKRVYFGRVKNVGRAFNQFTNEMGDDFTRFFLKNPILESLCGEATLKFAHAQTMTDLAGVAIGLERYWQVNGKYPETLAGLVPGFMEPPEIPHEIITGLPLHYERTSPNTFRLYATGWNEPEDGESAAASAENGAACWRRVWAWPEKKP